MGVLPPEVWKPRLPLRRPIGRLFQRLMASWVLIEHDGIEWPLHPAHSPHASMCHSNECDSDALHINMMRKAPNMANDLVIYCELLTLTPPQLHGGT